MGTLIIAGQHFNVDAPIVNYEDDPNFNAAFPGCVNTTRCSATGGIGAYGDHAKNHGAKRMGYRPALRRYADHPPLDAVKAILRMFVLHHDGMYSAESCFN